MASRNLFQMAIKLLARLASVAWLASLALAICVSGAAFAAEVTEGEPEQRIAAGVTAGGVPLGGLTVGEARAKLKSDLAEALYESIALEVDRQLFELDVTKIGLTMDALETAKQALQAKPKASVPLVVNYQQAKVRGFIRRVAQAVDLRPREAKVRVSLSRVKLVRESREGYLLPAGSLARRIAARLLDPSTAREILVAPKLAEPELTTREARRAYRTVLTVDRNGFKLRLFKAFKLRKTYPIALGATGFSTPAGIFTIANKQVNPSWHAPNRPWAGAFAGKTVPGGHPSNPLKARWLGIRDGVGIHGTGAYWSIGTRASHGCIRMRVPDVIDLYKRVPLDTPIRIG